MRLCLALHAFPPQERTGVETYAEALARALARRGHRVEVFALRRDPGRAPLAQVREERPGYAVTWLAAGGDSPREAERRAIPGVPRAFARFLDREQPELVHFQHLHKLGAELVDVARQRDRPVVFTGHDPFPVCGDYRLLAPDLSPLDPFDRLAQARAELARGALDGALAAHDGFLPVGEEGSELARAVGSVLRGEEVDAAAVERTAERIAEEVRERLERLARADRIEVPTRWLAELLEAGGLEAPVAVRACGIDAGALASIPPIDASRDGPLSVLYLGGLYEHKGVHVLLEAAAPLAGAVRVVLRGCAGSSAYPQHLAALADRAGAELGGPFERAELPGLLRAADCVVVPSLWPENAPFVIREAFAARRPVLASDTPALRESVRDRVDGRLFPVGDASALRGLLAEYAGDRAALARLAAGIEAPKSIEEDARELEELYAPLVAARAARSARRRSRLPEHVQPFASRLEALERTPTRELVSRALAGLERIGEHFGLAGAPDLAAALAVSPRLRERLAEARRALDWRAETARDTERSLAELRSRLAEAEAAAAESRRRAAWQEGLLAERDARIAWQEETLADRRRTVGALEAERDRLREGRDDAMARAEWLERELAGREAELAWTRETLEDARAHLSETGARLRDAESALESAVAEREGIRARTADELERTRAEREGLAKHAEWLEGELEARGREMEAAIAEARTLRQRLLGGALRRRLERWGREAREREEPKP